MLIFSSVPPSALPPIGKPEPGPDTMQGDQPASDKFADDDDGIYDFDDDDDDPDIFNIFVDEEFEKMIAEEREAMYAAAQAKAASEGKNNDSSSPALQAEKAKIDKEIDKKMEERAIKAKVQKLKRDAHIGRMVRNDSMKFRADAAKASLERKIQKKRRESLLGSHKDVIAEVAGVADAAKAPPPLMDDDSKIDMTKRNLKKRAFLGNVTRQQSLIIKRQTAKERLEGRLKEKKKGAADEALDDHIFDDLSDDGYDDLADVPVRQSQPDKQQQQQHQQQQHADAGKSKSTNKQSTNANSWNIDEFLESDDLYDF